MNLPFRQPSQPENETARIEAFSDGVFAIAITLLVLTVKIPTPAEAAQHGLFAELRGQWPVYLALAVSFFFILVMWINHHRLFTVVRRADNNLMLLNGLLLFGVTVVPLPTALLAEYLLQRDQTVALLVYDGWFFLVAIFFNVLWRYASHKNRLFEAAADPRVVAFISRSFNLGLLGYVVALLLAPVSPPLSLGINLALAVFFALPNQAMRGLDRAGG